jgi:stress response protein SCP2
VARRGPFEEVGLTIEDLQDTAIQIHSLARATDVLDHKFFGLAQSSLSRTEIENRWRNAKDNFEAARLTFHRIATKNDCAQLLAEIRRHPNEWAPEAVFCTVRSLLGLKRLATRCGVRAWWEVMSRIRQLGLHV